MWHIEVFDMLLLRNANGIKPIKHNSDADARQMAGFSKEYNTLRVIWMVANGDPSKKSIRFLEHLHSNRTFGSVFFFQIHDIHFR